MSSRLLILTLLLWGTAEARSPARRGPQVLHVADLGNTPEVFRRIHQELDRQGYRERRVVVREISRDRVETARRTGTDRDTKSLAWDWTKFDSNDATRAQRGISPERITYGVDVELNRSAVQGGRRDDVVRKSGGHVQTESYMADRDAPMRMGTFRGPKNAILVYDRNGLERAQINDQRRSAGVEFWFKKAPRESLRMILVGPKVQERRYH